MDEILSRLFRISPDDTGAFCKSSMVQNILVHHPGNLKQNNQEINPPFIYIYYNTSTIFQLRMQFNTFRFVLVAVFNSPAIIKYLPRY